MQEVLHHLCTTVHQHGAIVDLIVETVSEQIWVTMNTELYTVIPRSGNGSEIDGYCTPLRTSPLWSWRFIFYFYFFVICWSVRVRNKTHSNARTVPCITRIVQNHARIRIRSAMTFPYAATSTLLVRTSDSLSEPKLTSQYGLFLDLTGVSGP